ncbi:PC4/YdbC family ssDNA-binding protein [uncultured Treponema sp.]|uniref:YdbC family protein n=1 Tax=uncultured Treponema sp. TaxID=162155 RepID=UPI0025CC20B0|nr:PC4/YdbC family ssDNA-binding protein [uncultured Treponema sp.]
MAENFTYDFIGEHLTVAPGSGGWNLELNKISWNGKPAKYDLRSWSADHQKMGKGLTLTAEELKNLRDLLNSIEIS